MVPIERYPHAGAAPFAEPEIFRTPALVQDARWLRVKGVEAATTERIELRRARRISTLRKHSDPSPVYWTSRTTVPKRTDVPLFPYLIASKILSDLFMDKALWHRVSTLLGLTPLTCHRFGVWTS